MRGWSIGPPLVKLIPLVIFVVAGVGAIHRANFVQTVAPSTQGLGRAMILALFVLTGMEVSLSVSGEVKEPARTIPRALAIALVTVTLLYIAIQVIAQGILGASLSQSTVPLADAMAKISPVLRVVLLAGTALSMLGWVSSDILGTPRILFAFGRDGLLPRVLGRVHPRTHVPHVAILCYAAVAIALALTGTFAELAVLATLASSALYAAGCVAAWWLARNGVAQAGAPLNFRWLGTATVVGVGEHAADDRPGIPRGNPWPLRRDRDQRDRSPGAVPHRAWAATSRAITPLRSHRCFYTAREEIHEFGDAGAASNRRIEETRRNHQHGKVCVVRRIEGQARQDGRGGSIPQARRGDVKGGEGHVDLVWH